METNEHLSKFSMTGFALRRPITTLMFFLCFVITGIATSKLLPLEFMPDVTFPGIFVEVPYPGSSPEEIEKQITRPIEETLATMGGIQQMNSESKEDSASIQMFFDWDTDASIKGVEAREKLDLIRDQLPADLQRVFVNTYSTADEAFLQLRIASEQDLSTSYDLLDRNLKRRLERVPGVSRVLLHGVQKKQIRIQLRADRIAAHKVDVNALSDVLSRSNFSVTAGQITDGNQRLRVKPIGEYRSIDDIGAVIVGPHNLRLADIADIVYDQPKAEEGRHFERRFAIAMDVFKESSANLVQVSEDVLKEIEEAKKSPVFSDIRLFVIQNQAEGVQESLGDILRSGLEGAALSMLVLYFFLRQVSTTLIVSLAVPIALTITLAFMYFLGQSLNILSMMGLMLAVGLLVDNAVVVTESIFRYRKKFPNDPLLATELGVREVSIAVTAGTICTAIVFLPNIFGEKVDITVFLSHVAFTICISLFASLFIAKTIIPLLATRFQPPKEDSDSGLVRRLTGRYSQTVRWTLAHPRWSALFALILLVSAALPMSQVKKDMFPRESSDRVQLFYQLNGRYTLPKVEETVARVEKFLYEHKDQYQLDQIYSYYTPEFAVSILMFKDLSDSEKKADVLSKEIVEALPKIAIGNLSLEFEATGGGDQNIRLQVIGDSTEVLKPLAEDAVRALKGIKGLRDVRVDGGLGDKQVRVHIDRVRAQNLGLTPSQVAETIEVAMRGQPLRSYRAGDSETDIRLEFGQQDRRSLDDLKNLPLFRPDADSVALATVADLTVEPSANVIKREERSTGQAITAALDGLTMDEAKEAIKTRMDGMSFPPGYSWTYGRTFDREAKTGAVMGFNMLLAVALIYIVMAALFESLVFPTAVITSIVYAICGVFWYFWITDTTLSMMAMIGILVLMGVVVNNGIVLVDHINTLRGEGLSREDAIVQAGRDRLRPILMTASTAILALIPLSMGEAQVGGDGPPYFPMARAIIGGLSYATVTTLLVLPIIYLGLDNLRNWAGKVKLSAQAKAGRVVKAG
ncbi:MAG: efflux RND transporter permease subunit [Gammaproteobacteria bacterium]|nr:efflux RND transporter permease subunit [Gammaproteobacteria bacterium]